MADCASLERVARYCRRFFRWKGKQGGPRWLIVLLLSCMPGAPRAGLMILWFNGLACACSISADNLLKNEIAGAGSRLPEDR